MKLFSVSADDEPGVTVFANDMEQAACHFAIWRFQQTGSDRGEIVVGVMKPGDADGTLEELEAGLARGQPGVAMYLRFYGWALLAPPFQGQPLVNGEPR